MSYNLLHIIEHKISKDNERGELNFLVENISKKCMYCGRTNGKFVKEHVLPEGLGNNTFFTKNAECSLCNGIISTYEDSLVKMLAVDRILARGDMKKGNNPKFKYKSDSQSYIQAFEQNKKIHIGVDINSDDIYVGVNPNGSLHIAINHQKLSLGGICKALTHMAWPLLKEEHSKFSYVPEWILNKTSLEAVRIDVFQTYGPSLDIVRLEVWENEDKNSNYPYIIRYYYGFSVIQFYLPSSQSTSEEPDDFGDGINVPGHLTDGCIIFDNEAAKIERNSQWLLSNEEIIEDLDGSIIFQGSKVISIGGTILIKS